jgi:CheY-like chemotaxis protein
MKHPRDDELPITSRLLMGHGDHSRPRHILVVDDDPEWAMLLRICLLKLPLCEVAIAASGEQAVQLFERQFFHLLVTDHQLPGMDGLTLAARVRQVYPWTAIIMITGCNGLREQAARIPIHRLLSKPVNLDEVRAAVTEVLQTCFCPPPAG